MSSPKDPIKRAQWITNISNSKKGEKNPMFGRTGELCPAYGIRGEKHPFYGKHHSVKSIAKIKENHADFSGENGPMYGKTHSLEAIDKMSGENHPMYGKHHTEETIAKISVSRKGKLIGENNPNYIDGSCCSGNYPSYHSNFTEEFRQKIRERDNYICQVTSCGKIEQENGRVLDVHHIHYDEETNDCTNFDNFISLCRSCHIKKS